MHTHATSCIGETSLQNCQKTNESLGNIRIFLLLKPNFPQTKFNFLQRLSAFFNSFPLSSTAFWFSSTAFQFSSTAFHFPGNLRKSIYGEKYTKNHYLSFVFFATCSPTCAPSFVIPATIPNTNSLELLLSRSTDNEDDSSWDPEDNINNNSFEDDNVSNGES